MPPQIKICGLTNLADARLAAACGAAYLGLNFFVDSPRYLPPAAAEKLAAEIKLAFPTIRLVGVFVNASADEIQKTAELAQLDILQLHGDEGSGFCQQFEQPVWKAFRVKDAESLADLADFSALAGIVLDAYKKGAFGGTGQTADWELIHRVRDELPFFVLSGGLTPGNAAKASAQLRPDVLDICSGIELAGSPRQKDPLKIQKLFAALRP